MSTSSQTDPNGEKNVESGNENGISPAQPSVEPKSRQIRGFRWFVLLCSIYSSMFIFALDNTITANLVPVISNEFHSVDLLPWLSVGFMLGGYVALLPMGKLYAKYDAKWVYFVNIILFLGFSALCGAAPNMSAMIVGRVFLGVFGAAMYCGIMVLVALSTDDRERPGYFSITAVVWSVGTVLGPIVGGAFALVTWRWAFYINLVIGGVFAPICFFILPSYDQLPKSVTLIQRAKNYDFLGTTLLVAFSVCLIMAINLGGVLYSWSSGSIIALFVVGIILALAYGVQQKFSWLTTPDDRIFPVPLLHNKEAILLAVSMTCSNAASFIPIYYVPVYFQFALGDSPLIAAVRLIPLIVVFSVVNLSQGFLVVKLAYYWPWFVGGGVLLTAGNVMLYTINADTTPGYIYGAEVVIAIGMGLCNQAPYGVIQNVVPPAEMGLGVPFIMFAQYTGVTAGLSVAGAVFINLGLRDLGNLLPSFSEMQLSSILSGASGEAFEQVPENMRDAAIDVIVDNLRKTFIPAFFGGAVVLIVSFFLSKRKLSVNADAAVMVG
ncbi:major facilitator superfamily transporter [Biscogniauxia marginata]|nr:major facilitator superfamily transporter [Biscogniauxia marginata]